MNGHRTSMRPVRNHSPIYDCTPGSLELNRYVSAIAMSNSFDSNSRSNADCLHAWRRRGGRPPGGATGCLPSGATVSPPGGATVSPPGGATVSPPSGAVSPPSVATVSLPGGVAVCTPGGATVSPPGGATVSTPAGGGGVKSNERRFLAAGD